MLYDENVNRRVDTEGTDDEVLWPQAPRTPSDTAFIRRDHIAH